jgi:type II secretory pathway pseudopilin PulG
MRQPVFEALMPSPAAAAAGEEDGADYDSDAPLLEVVRRGQRAADAVPFSGGGAPPPAPPPPAHLPAAALPPAPVLPAAASSPAPILPAPASPPAPILPAPASPPAPFLPAAALPPAAALCLPPPPAILPAAAPPPAPLLPAPPLAAALPVPPPPHAPPPDIAAVAAAAAAAAVSALAQQHRAQMQQIQQMQQQMQQQMRQQMQQQQQQYQMMLLTAQAQNRGPSEPGLGGGSGVGAGRGNGVPAAGSAVVIPLLELPQQVTCARAWIKYAVGEPRLPSYVAQEAAVASWSTGQAQLPEAMRQPEAENPHVWRSNQPARVWSEWTRFGRYVDALTTYVRSGTTTVYTVKNVSQVMVVEWLDEWRAEDARALGMGTFGVLYYVAQPGLAPFFGQATMEDAPKKLVKSWQDKPLGKEVDVVRGARRKFVEALRGGTGQTFSQILVADFDAFFAANPDRAGNRDKLNL